MAKIRVGKLRAAPQSSSKSRKSSSGEIGRFGKWLIFKAKSNHILVPNNIHQSISATWVNHERIGKKPRSEFANPNLRTLTLEIEVLAQKSLKPDTIIARIEKAIEKGYVEYLIIGNKKIGKYRWKITEMDESELRYTRQGKRSNGHVTLTFEEYL